MPRNPSSTVRQLMLRLQRTLLAPALDLLLPARCFVCGRADARAGHLGACAQCWASLRPLRPPLCPSCGLPRPPGTDLLGPAGGRCAPCVVRPWPLDGLRAAVAYDEPARRFLLRAKFGGRRELLRPLGRQLARVVLHDGIAEGCAAVVAVPSGPWTRLRRGFNPAADLGHVVATTCGLPFLRGLLARRPGTAPSKRLGASGRRALAAGAFRARRKVAGKRLLLVDDVLTTGATARGCARALALAGARAVRLAVWARTLPGESGHADRYPVRRNGASGIRGLRGSRV